MTTPELTTQSTPEPSPANAKAIAYCDERIERSGRELRNLQTTIASELARIDRMRQEETRLKFDLDAWATLRSYVSRPDYVSPCTLCLEPCEFCLPWPAIAASDAGRD